MTNGEKIQSMFPDINFGTLAQDDMIVNKDYSNNDEPQVFIPKEVWDAEYKEPKSEWQQDHEILRAYSDGAENVIDNLYADIQKLRGCSCSNSDGIIDDVEDIMDEYRAEARAEE